jgi:dTDP-4-dehydrorhamnose reductase
MVRGEKNDSHEYSSLFFFPNLSSTTTTTLSFYIIVDDIELFLGEARLENRETVAKELDTIQPSHVLNAAGITGRPNIDWCETHKPETIRTNVIGTLNLADLCYERNVHCTVYATGCIFEYDDEHPLGSGIGFTEEDVPNFAGSFYSQTKGYMV